MNVTELARSCGLSRTTVLYYEAEALWKPARRSASGYRVYGEGEPQRLQSIGVEIERPRDHPARDSGSSEAKSAIQEKRRYDQR